jgi:hypothetical protein
MKHLLLPSLTVLLSWTVSSEPIDLSHWKLTLPLNKKGTYGGHPKEISVKQLAAGFKDHHFHIDPNDGMIFWCPVIGSTSENTDYPRSELREMLQPGNPRHNWAMPGTHILEARCRVLQVPSNPKVIIGQIHSFTGKSKPLVKLQYFKGRIEALVKMSPVDGNDKKLTFPDVGLNHEFTWKIKLKNGVLSMSVNGKTKTENMIEHDKRWANQTFYFKAGAYPQDNQGNADEGARVAFSHLVVRHEK